MEIVDGWGSRGLGSLWEFRNGMLICFKLIINYWGIATVFGGLKLMEEEFYEITIN